VEQIETYKRQGEAAVEERALNEVRATAEMQTKPTQSSVQVPENEGPRHWPAPPRMWKPLGSPHRPRRTAGVSKVKVRPPRLLRSTPPMRVRLTPLRAYGGPEYRLAEQFAVHLFQAIAAGHQPVVPQIMVAGEGTGGAQNGLVTGLVARLLPAARDRPSMLPPAQPAK
jgi:hypothetical protein